MKYGVRGHDLGRVNPKEAAVRLKAAGFDCVQLVFHKLLSGLSSYDDPISDETLAIIKESFQKEGFEAALVGCYQDLANPEREEYNLKIYELSAKRALAIGAKYVGTESAFTAVSNEEIASRRDTLLKMAPRISSRLAALGVTLLLEPVGRQPLHSVELCEEIIKAAPQTCFIFDAANIMRDEEVKDQQKLWAHWFSSPEFVKRVKMVHFKDFKHAADGSRISCPLGAGFIDWGCLKEHFKRLPNAEYAIREAQDPALCAEELQFMKSII